MAWRVFETGAVNLSEFCFLLFSRSILRFRASNFARKLLVFIIKSARGELYEKCVRWVPVSHLESNFMRTWGNYDM